MATINGTFNSLIAGTLSGTVATPGAQGPTGPAGPTGPTGPAGAPGVGVPAGGLTAQFLSKASDTSYDTTWSTVSLGNYLVKANNLSDLTNFATARDNLGLGLLYSPTFAGLTLQGSGANVGQYTPTSLTLTHATSGSFVIQPSSGITFPDTSVQTTAFVAGSGLPTGGTVGQVLTKNSGTNFDASFATLIPGDRYLTSSTTSLTIDNANKTLTIGTGLSYTTQQDVVIAYDANNHMHAQVLTYNSGTGVMTVDVRSHSGTGTFSLWTVNVGGTVPETSVSWGSILGVLGNQADLAGALSAKLEVSTAASTYFTISSAAGKANLSGATFTGKVNLATIGVGSPSVNLGGQCDPAPASATNGDLWISNAASPKLTYRAGGVNYNLAVLNQFNTFTGQMVINTTSSSTAALRVTQLGAANAIEVEDSTTPDATRFVVDANGKVGVGVAPDATAALKVDGNGIMFGDGTTQTTAATSSPFDADRAKLISLATSTTASCSSFVYNNVSGPNGIYFTFNIVNQAVLGLMLYSPGGVSSITLSGSSSGLESFTCSLSISGSGATVTTDTYYWIGSAPTGATYDIFLNFTNSSGQTSSYPLGQVSP
jgi:hypothetical protein